MSGPGRKPPLTRVDRVFADVAGGLLVLMMLITVVSSISRFLFNAPIPDVEAIDEMLLVGVVVLPFAYLQLNRGHVEVTAFTDSLPARARRQLALLGYLVGLIAFGLLLYGLVRGALQAWQFGDTYFGINKIPTWPARSLASIGVLAVTVRLLLDLVSGVRELLAGERQEK